MTTNNVASASTLTPNPEVPPAAPEDERAGGHAAEGDSPLPAPEAPKRRRRGRRAAQPDEPVVKVPGEVHLAALGRLVLEAAKAGLTVDEYAEHYLVPMAEAYALYKRAVPDS